MTLSLVSHSAFSLTNPHCGIGGSCSGDAHQRGRPCKTTPKLLQWKRGCCFSEANGSGENVSPSVLEALFLRVYRAECDILVWFHMLDRLQLGCSTGSPSALRANKQGSAANQSLFSSLLIDGTLFISLSCFVISSSPSR